MTRAVRPGAVSRKLDCHLVRRPQQPACDVLVARELVAGVIEDPVPQPEESESC